MADMDDFSKILQSFMASGLGNGFGGDSSDNQNDRNEQNDGSEEGFQENSGGFDFFGGIDMDMLMKMGSIFARMQQPDQNTALLTALRPMLRSENQVKIDTAMKLVRMMAILPFLRDSGL